MKFGINPDFLKKYLVLVFFLPAFFAGQHSVAQHKILSATDSLKIALKATKSDTTKLRIYHALYAVTDSLSFARKELELCTDKTETKYIAQAYLDIGRYYYFFTTNQDSALNYLKKSIQLGEAHNYVEILANAYRYMGFMYRASDSYTAESYYRKSLMECQKMHNELLSSYDYSAIGNIYEAMKTSLSNKAALEFYGKSLEIRQRLGSYEEKASSLLETSRVYELLGEFYKSFYLREQGLELAEKANDKTNIIYLSHLLGVDYTTLFHNYDKGLTYQLHSYELALTQRPDYEVLFQITRAAAHTYDLMGNTQKAAQFFELAVTYIDSLGTKTNVEVFTISSAKHNLELELEREKNKLVASEISKQKTETERQEILKYAFLIGFALFFVFAVLLFRAYRRADKTNSDLELTNKKLETAYQELTVSEQKFKQITETINDVFYLFNIEQMKYEYISPNCFKLFGLDQDFFYSGKSMKTVVHENDVANVIDANVKVNSGLAYDIEYRIYVDDDIRWVSEKSFPIFDANGKLLRNSGVCRDITGRKRNEEIIENKNQDITDSMNYASTIQNTILASKETMLEHLKEIFIVNQPKDIVSGDFYYYAEVHGKVIIAACDCTGHGVPGAIVSIFCSNALHRAVKRFHISETGKILDKARELVIETFGRAGSEVKDGMDISIACIDPKTGEVQWSGANNPLLYIHNNEMQEIAPDKQPIGMQDNPKPFTTNTIQLAKGDSLYLLSDGYADQFGGPRGKKYTKKNLRDLLLSVHNKSMDEQGAAVIKAHQDWKGINPQVDDILVIGIRV